ncbi:MAG: signal peptidase II [Armatimonadota bacterium]|nr:signal peptidase II [Armatimonadota bacterium]
MVVDQVVKILVVRLLPGGASVAVIPGILWLTPVRNTGVAFGLLAGLSPTVTVLAALTLFFVLFYNKGRRSGSRMERAGIALMAGGAAGNLLDRIRLGFVVDYLDLRAWPVFNLADVAIVLGAGALALALAREGRPPQFRR